MKTLITMCLLWVTSVSCAQELNGQDWKTLTWLSQTARVHAQKTCAGRAEKLRPACEAEQMKSLAESAASLTAFVPANISPRDFAWMIENQARSGGQLGLHRQAGYETSNLDCRVNVC